MQQRSKAGSTATQQQLIIGKAGKKKLSKNQEAFNKLTQRIERLQKEIEKKQLQYDMALKVYGTELYPEQLRILASRQKLIVVLWEIYQANKLSKPDQRQLKQILQYHLQELFAQTETEPDEQVQAIFTKLEGVSYDKMVADEHAKQTAEMLKSFQDIDVDVAGIDVKDEAAIAAKIAEARARMAEIQAEHDEKLRQREAKKQKTSKQVAYEKVQKAVDEMKQKNISTIYKQLAKLFHPDLEQDETRKLDKEILMKDLISAYEAKNLHALLMLELKWIHKETDHLESLTEEKLSIYLQILREQASSLEQDKNNLLTQPQYAVLAQEFGYGIQKYPIEIVQQQVKDARYLVKQFNKDVAAFESPLALRNVKEMIKQWKQREKEYTEDELLQMFFDQ